MSLLYKKIQDQTYKVDINKKSIKDEIELIFWSDCGKFGTDEILDGYRLTPLRLLEILQDREDITEEEQNF